jgi:hypothetical protein
MLSYFIQKYYSEIADKIENQQIKHGLARIHSHRHISRCVIYCDWYANVLNISRDSIDRLRLYFLASMHDIGREGELIDVWETKSYQMYLHHIATIKIDNKYVNNKNEIIIYKNNNILTDIIHDVDCLDIMRIGTGRGGIMGFQKSYLNLFKDNSFIQDKMVSDAWQLINLTDGMEYENKDCLKTICEKNKNEWKIAI